MRVDRIFNGDASGVAKEVKPEMRLGQVHPSNEAILESEKARSLRGMRSFLLSLSFFSLQSDATHPKNKNDLVQRRAFSRLSKNVFDAEEESDGQDTC